MVPYILKPLALIEAVAHTGEGLRRLRLVGGHLLGQRRQVAVRVRLAQPPQGAEHPSAAPPRLRLEVVSAVSVGRLASPHFSRSSNTNRGRVVSEVSEPWRGSINSRPTRARLSRRCGADGEIENT